MKIDTEVRHVTKPGANLFLELGLRQMKPSGCTWHRNNRSTTPSSLKSSSWASWRGGLNSII